MTFQIADVCLNLGILEQYQKKINDVNKHYRDGISNLETFLSL